MVLDVDGLKQVNNTEGHAAGDTLLRDAAEAITTSLRSYDVTVCWGGDEFRRRGASRGQETATVSSVPPVGSWVRTTRVPQ